MTGAEVEAALRDLLREEAIKLEAARHRGNLVLVECPPELPQPAKMAELVEAVDARIRQIQSILDVPGRMAP